MLIIDYKRSFRALNSYIDAYNEGKAHAGRIKSAVAHTGKEVIRIYGAYLLKASSIIKIDPDKLPPLKTNNVQLAKLTKASSRTIQRHIIKLQEAGIITGKKNHGTRSCYDLLITREILLNNLLDTSKKGEKDEKKIKLQDAEKDHVKTDIKPNCPYSYTGYISNNLLIEVENIERGKLFRTKENLQRCSLTLTGCSKILTGYTGDKGGAVENIAGDKGCLQAGPGGKKEKPCAGAPPARLSQLQFYAGLLWLVARNTIYKGVFLTDRQVEKAKELLLSWYVPIRDENLSKIHKRYIDRLFLAKKFVEKDPKNRFIQLPNRYFDLDNPYGFRGTKKWYHLQLIRQQEVSENFILHAQIKKFLNNEKKGTAERRPSLEVFRECEQRLGKLNRPGLLDKFYAAILGPEVNDNIGAGQKINKYA